MTPRILVIATLDTKETEARYLCRLVSERGADPVLLDVGILGNPVAPPDVTHDQVAAAEGLTIGEVRDMGSRGAAVSAMMKGVAKLVATFHERQPFAGGVGIGGAEGAVLAASALGALPFGMPKMIVSPILSGVRACGPFVGTNDIALLHSVADMQGVNSVTARILELAATYVTGGAHTDLDSWPEPPRGRVAMTMNGNTTTIGTAVTHSLEALGHEVVAFHSNGVGGKSMERLLEEGAFVAAVDLATNELVEEVVGGLFPVEGRLLLRAGTRIPRVVLPGCLDFICQGSPQTIDPRFRNRRMDFHNPEVTLVQVSRAEASNIAAAFVGRLEASEGQINVVLPIGGLSLGGSSGGVFCDGPDWGAVEEALLERLANSSLSVKVVDAAINDASVATAVLDCFSELVVTSAV